MLGTIEKITVVALVALLLTAAVGIWASWNEMQKEERACPVTIVNKTVYVNSTNSTSVAGKPMKPNPQPTPSAHKTLVFLYMSNCPYCEQMKPIVDDLIVKSYGDSFRAFDVLHINTDSDPGAFARYNATSTPTIIILQNGREIARFGVTDEQTLINALN